MFGRGHTFILLLVLLMMVGWLLILIMTLVSLDIVSVRAGIVNVRAGIMEIENNSPISTEIQSNHLFTIQHFIRIMLMNLSRSLIHHLE